jgi:hypothetical protein
MNTMAADDRNATYVYCVFAAPRPPRRRGTQGVAGTGAVRLLPIAPPPALGRPARRSTPARRLWAAVADAPRAHFSAPAIARGLRDVDWVSRAAVAHEAVVESFRSADALLPMKLFTIFASDARAVAHLEDQGARIDELLGRVAGHDEWGVRVALQRPRTIANPPGASRAPRSGAEYLTRKKGLRDLVSAQAETAHDVVSRLYDRLAGQARLASRRATLDQAGPAGPMLLDAAFLVTRARAATFRAKVALEAKTLAPHGYRLTMTGPWPPYTFVQD